MHHLSYPSRVRKVISINIHTKIYLFVKHTYKKEAEKKSLILINPSGDCVTYMYITHVFFQIKISTKTFRTYHTCIWFDVGMCVHMKF